MPQKILLLTANPTDTERLNLGAELREIDDNLRRTNAGRFQLVQRHAVRSADLRRVLLEEKPLIVHFAGHGQAGGIVLEDDDGQAREVSAAALAEVFGLFADSLRLVVLNACYSDGQAAALAQRIDWVAGLEGAADDRAARDFAAALYHALGNGETVQFAFDYACKSAALEARGDIRPRLHSRPGAPPLSVALDEREITTPAPPPPDPQQQRTLDALRRQMQDLMQQRLAHNLHRQVRVTLGMETQPERIEHPWQRLLYTHETTAQALPADTSILHAWREAQYP